MIQFQQVSKFYNPEIVALRDVSFDIDQGEFLFLIGPSGAGKSTLIRLLIRQEDPTQGTILFDETDILSIRKHLLPVYRQQIGVVFQDYKLLDTKTIRENVSFALEITGKLDSEVKETTDSLLDLVGLSDRQDLFPEQLSGGEKQRAGIARALANEPKLLIADEPTGNLDPETSFEIMKILQTVNEWGTTVMIATHDKEVVDAMNQRVVRLENGTIVSDKKGGYTGNCNEDKKPAKSRKIEIEAASALQTEQKATKPDIMSDLDQLPVSTAVKRQLRKNNIVTIDQLLDLSENELIGLDGIGDKKAQDIVNALESFVNAPPHEHA